MMARRICRVVAAMEDMLGSGIGGRPPPRERRRAQPEDSIPATATPPACSPASTLETPARYAVKEARTERGAYIPRQ
jgi:hypothetical protein